MFADSDFQNVNLDGGPAALLRGIPRFDLQLGLHCGILTSVFRGWLRRTWKISRAGLSFFGEHSDSTKILVHDTCLQEQSSQHTALFLLPLKDTNDRVLPL